MPFDHSGAPGQGEAGDDCAAVTVDACGEHMEAWEVVSPDGVEPLRQPFVLTLGEHLDEEADVTGDCFEFRAVDQNGLEPKVFPLVEAIRSAGGSIRRQREVTVAERWRGRERAERRRDAAGRARR